MSNVQISGKESLTVRLILYSLAQAKLPSRELCTKEEKFQQEGHRCLKLVAQAYVAIKRKVKGKHRNRKRKQQMNLVTKVAHTSYDVYPPLGTERQRTHGKESQDATDYIGKWCIL